MLKKLVVTVLAVLLAASLCPARTIENVDLPETMEIGDKTVALNGGGVRTSMYLKTYVGGLYVREAKTGADAVINADEPMAIRLHMLEDVGQQTMKTAIHNGFRTATGDNIEPIESEIDTFMECFSDPIKKGEVFEFAYLPGKGTEIYKQGELRSTIEGLEFKKAMFGIWFSDKPADKKLKKGMLAGDIRVSPEKLAPEGETAVATAEKPAEEKAEEKAVAETEAKEKAAAEKEAADKAKAAAEKAVAAAEKQQDAPAAGSGAEAKTAGETAAAAGAAAGKAAAGKKKDQQIVVKRSPEKNLPASATVQEAAAEETAARSETEKPEKQKAGEKAEEKAAAAAEKQPAEKVEKQAGQKEQKVPGTSVTRAQVVEEDIYFDVNDASLSDQALDRLARKKEWLSANPDTSVYVEVYCDYRGSEDYNTWLAHKRGRSVKTYLVNEGIAPARIRVKIRGEEKSSGGENMDKSRRAHFKIKE